MTTHDPNKLAIESCLHDLNNALQVFGMQAELARLHIEHGNYEQACEALDLALRERSLCKHSTRSLQQACGLRD